MCSHTAWLRLGTSLPMQKQQNRLQAGGVVPQKWGRHCPPARPPLTLFPVEELCPLRGVLMGTLAWPGRAIHPGHTEGASEGTPKAQWGMSPGPRKGPKGPSGTSGQHGNGGRPCSQCWEREEHTGEHLWGWEKDETPPGCSCGGGSRRGHLTNAPRAQHCHQEKNEAPQECTQSPSSLLGKGCASPGLEEG